MTEHRLLKAVELREQYDAFLDQDDGVPVASLVPYTWKEGKVVDTERLQESLRKVGRLEKLRSPDVSAQEIEQAAQVTGQSTEKVKEIIEYRAKCLDTFAELTLRDLVSLALSEQPFTNVEMHLPPLEQYIYDRPAVRLASVCIPPMLAIGFLGYAEVARAANGASGASGFWALVTSPETGAFGILFGWIIWLTRQHFILQAATEKASGKLTQATADNKEFFQQAAADNKEFFQQATATNKEFFERVTTDNRVFFQDLIDQINRRIESQSIDFRDFMKIMDQNHNEQTGAR